MPVALIAHAIAANVTLTRAGDLPATPLPAEPVFKTPPPPSGSFWIGADYLPCRPPSYFNVVAKDFGDFANKLGVEMAASALSRGGLKGCIVAWVEPPQAT